VWQTIALSFGLAMDATAVSGARGLANRQRELLILPVIFGVFQIGMAALGWILGAWIGPFLASWDYWIAFGLLSLIGLKMVYEAWTADPDDPDDADGDGNPDATGPGVYLGLAIATSIDAAAAGLTLPLLPVDPWIALVMIGAMTTVCSAAGFVAGRVLGHRLGRKLEIAGGAVLIGIGVEILVSGLMS
jgi:putative Mn2+ efflux pump MntP